MASALISISILPATLKLVKIPRAQVNERMYEINRSLSFRDYDRVVSAGSASPKDPFYSLTMNEVELSIFADTSIVDKVFARWLEHDTSERDSIEVGLETWVAMQVEQHGDEWEQAGARVKEISAPLAAQGISILFLSTYISDFILIKEHRLGFACSILESSGFRFQASPDDFSASMSASMTVSPSRERPVGTSAKFLDESSRTVSTQSGSSVTRSMTGSLILNSSQNSPLLSRSRGKSSSADLSLSPNSSRQNSAGQSPEDFQTSLSKDSKATEALDSTLSGPRSFPDSDDVFTEAMRAKESAHGRNLRSASTTSAVSSSTSAMGDKISILPDELVCIGLNAQDETAWSHKVISALFYCDVILPSRRLEGLINGIELDIAPEIDYESVAASLDERERDFEGVSIPSTHSSPVQEVAPSTLRQTDITFDSLRRNAGRSRDASVESAIGATEMLRLASNSTIVTRNALLPTAESPYPTPFISLTQTLEGTSLTGDIRLLRLIFSPAEETNMVHTLGDGGLHGHWRGEEGELETNELPARGRPRIRKSSSGEPFVGGQMEDAGSSVFSPDEDEEELDMSLPELPHTSSRRPSQRSLDGGRRLYKCLQLDLSSFGLGQHSYLTLLRIH
ncbi:uncharacterized protein L969DRAFT_83969 [Mixia osmundae IAM 14324]|uniref:uncharacterized protein n=1 Tax=Mixia osmundae (strain CBS 9802 / IAM 14324 / JCM 22182 / KY 12970) TaxID=764103 RepID=UPI0004A5567C|nr:uncharacterized protein L969DRAFT_83969 [Mixia osmundae IAM 14324]KEI42102.1 hypothetical protein L969DRAFT_83969 [Mixia osmundae IAM 14324]